MILQKCQAYLYLIKEWFPVILIELTVYSLRKIFNIILFTWAFGKHWVSEKNKVLSVLLVKRETPWFVN